LYNNPIGSEVKFLSESSLDKPKYNTSNHDCCGLSHSSVTPCDRFRSSSLYATSGWRTR